MELVRISDATQLKELTDMDTKVNWVERPDCSSGSKGADNSVPLAEDISNATSATCKSQYVPGSYDPTPFDDWRSKRSSKYNSCSASKP